MGFSFFEENRAKPVTDWPSKFEMPNEGRRIDRGSYRVSASEQLKVLSEVELDFSIEVSGFEMAEIDLLIEHLAPATPGKEDPADAIPESRSKPQVTQAGDVWNLDRHRIYCRDARDNAACSFVMQGRRAAAVFTDLPYNDRIAATSRISEKFTTRNSPWLPER